MTENKTTFENGPAVNVTKEKLYPDVAPIVPAAEPPTNIETAQANAAADQRSAKALLISYGPVVVVLVVLIAAAGIFVPYFLTGQNVLNILQQMAIIGVVSLGMTFVILTAGIDLSVGATLELVTVVFAACLQHGFSVWLSILIGLALGAVVGLINGLGFTMFRIQPFVVTLAMLAVAEGLALTLSGGGEVYFTTQSSLLTFLGGGGIGKLSGEFIVFAVLAILGWIVLRFVPFGRFVYAVGGSAETARLSGIPVKRILTATYVICGVLAALAGIMTACRLEVGVPTAGGLTNLDAIAAVVIGGTSLMGGRGSIWGTVVGAFILAIISNIITLLGISPYQSEIIRGCVIIAAVLLGSFNFLRGRRAAARAAA